MTALCKKNRQCQFSKNDIKTEIIEQEKKLDLHGKLFLKH